MQTDLLAPAVPAIPVADEPWTLPEGWTWARLGDLVRLRGDKADPKADGHLPFVGMDDIEPDGLTIKRRRSFSTMSSAGNRFKPGDILYGRLRPYLNKTAIADGEGACSGELLVLLPGTAVEARYVQLILHGRRFVAWISAQTLGDRPRIGFDALATFEVPLPPLAEQHRIVAYIDELFAEIANGEAALQAARDGLDTFRRALLKAAVTGDLTADWRAANRVNETGRDLLARIQAERETRAPGKTRGQRSDPAPAPEMSALPDLPEGWAWGRLSGLGVFGRGKSKHRPRDDARLYGGTMPFIQTGIVANAGDYIRAFQQTYSEFGVAQSAVWPSGTLCITIAANIAKTAITTFECCFPDSIVGLQTTEQVDPYWVHVWLQTIQKRIERYAPATAQKNINLEVLDAVFVPLPPPAETVEILSRITAALAAVDDTRSSLDAEARDAAALRQSILKAAFEGRLVPQDPADEPAAALLARLGTGDRPAPRARRRRAP